MFPQPVDIHYVDNRVSKQVFMHLSDFLSFNILAKFVRLSVWVCAVNQEAVLEQHHLCEQLFLYYAFSFFYYASCQRAFVCFMLFSALLDSFCLIVFNLVSCRLTFQLVTLRLFMFLLSPYIFSPRFALCFVSTFTYI